MAAPRPKKKAPVKKKPPAKKAPKPKKPSFLRKDTPRPARDIKPGDLRSQTLANDNTPRPAKDLNKGGLRAKFLQDAAKSAASRTIGTVLRTGLKVAGPVGALASMTVPAGEGSTVPGQAQKAVEKKMKREIRQGPKLAVTGVKEGITGPTPRLRKEQLGEIKYRTPIGPKRPSNQIGLNEPPRWRKDASWKYNSPIGPKKASTGSPFSKGKGNAALPKGKTSPSNTAATSAAAGSSGGSQAAAVAKAGSSKTKVGRQTSYQRNELAMEQKRSSNRPKKSIFSLFRKG
jgi:hypothetical protein